MRTAIPNSESAPSSEIFEFLAPNDLKFSDCGGRHGTCMVGGKTAAEAGAVMTYGAVRCTAHG